MIRFYWTSCASLEKMNLYEFCLLMFVTCGLLCLLFYWLLLVIRSTDFFICIARSFIYFFKRQKATEQTAFVPDRQKSIFCSNWKELLSYEQFSKSMENYIQSSELLTLNSFLFVAARPVFCCLQALVWTQKATWKWNQFLFPRWVYSSRDIKHRCLFLCLQKGTDGDSKWA